MRGVASLLDLGGAGVALRLKVSSPIHVPEPATVLCAFSAPYLRRMTITGFLTSESRGLKKHINFFNVNLLAPTQNAPSLDPQKRVYLAVKTQGPGEEGAAGYCPKILLPKRAKMVLCSFHTSHREICTRNRPLSETKFLDGFWGLSRPHCLAADLCASFGGKRTPKRDRIHFFGGGILGQRVDTKRGTFGHIKFSVLFLTCT